MDRFVVKENIHRFQLLLEQEMLPERRRTIEGLLHAEQAKLAVQLSRPAEDSTLT